LLSSLVRGCRERQKFKATKEKGKVVDQKAPRGDQNQKVGRKAKDNGGKGDGGATKDKSASRKKKETG